MEQSTIRPRYSTKRFRVSWLTFCGSQCKKLRANLILDWSSIKYNNSELKLRYNFINSLRIYKKATEEILETLTIISTEYKTNDGVYSTI